MKKAVTLMKIIFSASYFFLHMFNMSIISAKHQIASINTWRQVVFTVYGKTTFQEEQRELTVKELNP